ncbi:hypothetical protein [Vibrio palustris]|uniref:DUF3899 domain-containing protein n=1 Tax=Vibrio palustris TaxID=1918946 RepID=A0A1R4B6L3_9VIBR|nr:hypothetical protein [Vibrio palustris]SJL84511.1 hypothetical protein VPAL9027_02500 [Vibrio palustris]
MKSLLKFTVVTNVALFVLLWIEERYVHFFGIVHWIDYAFFMLIMLWAAAVLIYLAPRSMAKGTQRINPLYRQKVMQAKREAKEQAHKQETSPHADAIPLAVAGLPCLVLVIFYHFVLV